MSNYRLYVHYQLYCFESKMLTVVYPNKTYEIDPSIIDCELFDTLLLDKDGVQTVELKEFQDVFEYIISRKEEIKEWFSPSDTFPSNISQDDKTEYFFRGLSYFGSHKNLGRLFLIIKNGITSLETKRIQTSIEDFFICNKEYLDWDELCTNTSLSEDFFERHLDKVNWNVLSQNDMLSPEFFKRHIKHVHWYYFCIITVMSEEFWEEEIKKDPFDERIEWDNLCMNNSLSESFWKRHLDKIDWTFFCNNESISEKFWEENIDKVVWSDISSNESLSEEFFERHLDKLDWYWICQNSSISEEFYERHIKKIKWASLSQNTNLTEAFWNKHIDKAIWTYLNKHPYLSEAFWERNIDNARFDSLLSHNIVLSQEFFNRHKWGRDSHQAEISLAYWMFLANNPSTYETFWKEKIVNMEEFTSIFWSNLSANNFSLEQRIIDTVKNTRYYTFDKMWKNYVPQDTCPQDT